MAKPKISITINRRERTRTDPAKWSVPPFRYFFCLFLRIAPGVWLSSALIDIQEILLIWVAFPVKHPNELSTRSIYMVANMISVIGKFVFVLTFGLRRSQYLASQSTGKKEHEPTQPIDQFLRFIIIFVNFWESLVGFSWVQHWLTFKNLI